MSTELVVKPISKPSTSGSKVIQAVTRLLPVDGCKEGGLVNLPLRFNLGVSLSLLGYHVILVDGDWGGADLHLFFNQIAPSRSMSHFLPKEVKSLKDLALTTFPSPC